MSPLCERRLADQRAGSDRPSPGLRSRRTARTPRHGSRRRGAALVEFALIALSFYVLFASAIELGRLMFSAQALQDVARTLGRQLALQPFPPSKTLLSYTDLQTGEYRVGALDEPLVRRYIYDPRRLVVDLDDYPMGAPLDQWFAEGPVVNQMMRPLMIVDRIQVGSASRELLRYPGALVRDNDPLNESGLTVMIPHVLERGEQGVETLIRWLPVVEEVRPEAPYDETTSPFSLLYNIPELAGMVSIRVNYPFQAATMLGYTEPPGGPLDPNLGEYIAADADGTSIPAAGGNEPTLLPLADQVGPNAGPYGLGVMLAYGTKIRPFRRLISAQAVFRREVFE